MIKKAVLPVAGVGTRFLPASKATPKEMLPIIDKPLVQYAVEEAIDVGVDEIIFITSNEKHSIEKHFQANNAIAEQLIKSGKEEYLERLNPKIFSDVKFHYINQNNQHGLGDAVLHAEEIVGDDSFAVLLPDVLFFSNIFSVRFPVPGPISKTISELDISPLSIIFDKIFLSFRKFCPKLFFGI